MKSVLFLLALFFINPIYSQTNFTWDISDTISKSKDQIYSDVKLFVAKSWKSANHVIQNDDKDAGVVLVRGVIAKSFSFLGAGYAYDYSYIVTFRMKDGKYKFTIDNVYCEKAYMTTSSYYIPKVEPFDGDNCPETGTFKKPGPPAKRLIPMMASVKMDLQSIYDVFQVAIREPSLKDGDW